MWIFIGIFILAVNVLRFVGLESSPPGFYIDEAFSAANSICLKETGHDFFGAPLSFFYKIYNINVLPASFYLGEAFWSSLFGNSIASFRSFIAMIAVLTLLGLFKFVERISKDQKLALLVTLLASIMPWCFQTSRITWEPSLGPCFLVWGLFFIYSPKFNWKSIFASAFFLASAAYAYAPTRAQVVLMLMLLPGVSIKNKFQLGISFGIFCLPLVSYYFDPDFTIRTKLMALNSSYAGNPYRDDTFFELVGDFLKQMALHLSPSFLLQSGDHNLRHSIQSFGEIDYLTALSVPFTLIIAFSKKLKAQFNWKHEYSIILKLSVLGILTGIAPAALTWEGIPHANRALGAWPFFAIIGGIGLKLLIDRFPKTLVPVAASSILFFALFAYNYFFVYPKISADWFDQRIVSMADRGTFPADYRPLARAYFLMANQHLSCEYVKSQLKK